MAGLTKKELKELIKEAVKETITDSGILKDLLSECIKTSVVMIIKEINIPETQMTENRKQSQVVVPLFEEKPLVTGASRTKAIKKEPVTNADSLREMFSHEFGMDPPIPGVSFGKVPPSDMVDTEQDDPRVLKALGLV